MEYELNLLPADILEEESCKERIKIWAYGLIGILLICLAMGVTIKHSISSLNRDIHLLQSIKMGLLEEKSQIGAIKEERGKILKLRREFKDLTGQGPLMGIFKAIDRSIDGYTTLTRVSGTFNHTSSDALEIQGITPSMVRLGNMLQKLAASPVFKDVQLVHASQGKSDRDHQILFKIKCKISA